MKPALLIGGLILLLPFGAQAQRKLRNPTNARAEVQLEYVRTNGDFFWGSLHTRLDLKPIGRMFEYAWGQAGYEHFWSERWSAGLNARVISQERQNGGDVVNRDAYFQPELLLRHRGDVFGLTFGQRLSIDYLFLPAYQRNLGVARLRLDLERLVPVGEKLKLRPRLAYEAAANIRLQPPEGQPEERTLEQGIWRAEIGLRFSDRFDLTPYVARQADFAVYLPQFDSDGNQVGGGRTNVRTPVIGLDLRYTLFQGGRPFERKTQLPTQH